MVTDEAGGDIRKRGWAKDVTLKTDLRLVVTYPVQTILKLSVYSVFTETLKLRFP